MHCCQAGEPSSCICFFNTLTHSLAEEMTIAVLFFKLNLEKMMMMVSEEGEDEEEMDEQV